MNTLVHEVRHFFQQTQSIADYTTLREHADNYWICSSELGARLPFLFEEHPIIHEQLAMTRRVFFKMTPEKQAQFLAEVSSVLPALF